MKKRMLVLILSVLLFTLTACGAVQEKEPFVGPDEAVMSLKIVELRDNGFLGVGEGGSAALYTVSLSADAVCYDETAAVMDFADLRPGMVVSVYWNGMILETWPGQIGGVSALQVLGQQDDLVGLYLQVLNDLWDTDPALNHDVTRLGMDFSGLTNLTEVERRALEYVFSCDVDLFAGAVTGTWQELCDAGLIDGENLYWEDGVFLSISVTKEGDETFSFDAQKWRSGTGAIWFNGCRAKPEKNGQWSYEVGSFAIS